ncbi:hypothetical protein E2C01_090455 [Portunus trituberculatus]|nr:hypothetical protein [Portunus trituberculatus]
MPILPV